MLKNFNIKKAFWFTLGCILLGVAFIGIYLPGLPWSTPAVGAAYCFAKSSDRMHNWIMNHKLFGPFLRGWSGGFMALVAIWAWRFPGSHEEHAKRVKLGKKIAWLK